MKKIDEVILIGNYVNDSIRSMDMFAETLQSELQNLGIKVTTIRPEPFWGKRIKGSTGIGKWFGYLDKFFVFPKRLRQFVKDHDSDKIIYHICDQSNAFYIKHLPIQRTVVTIHDLMAIQASLGHFEGIRIGWTGKQLQKIILKGVKQTQHFTCVSEASLMTLSDLTQQDQSDAVVIPNALVQPLLPKETRPNRWKESTPSSFHTEIGDAPYLLHVGNDNWYKNRDALFQIFSSLATKDSTLKLVLVGPPPSNSQAAMIDEAALKRVFSYQQISQEALNELYSNAELLLFPSLMEGFGWPILEATSCGCPVVLCRKQPMTEVAGTTGYYLSKPEEFASLKSWTKDASAKVKLFLQDASKNSEENLKKRSIQCTRFAPETIFPQYPQKYLAMLEKIKEETA